MKTVLVIILSSMLVLSGCATGTKEGMRWNIIGAGVIAGAAGGAAFAPKDEKREIHALNWAAIIGLGAAFYALIFHSDKKRLKKLERENYILKNKPDFEILDKFNAKLSKPLFKGGPTEGKWEYIKIDRWIRVDENQLIHQDREFLRADEKSKGLEKEKK